MKKEDLKQSIDLIKPDPYMENRLKAKIASPAPSVRTGRRIVLGVTTFCLTFAIVFGFGSFLKPNSPVNREDIPNKQQNILNNEQKTQSSQQETDAAILEPYLQMNAFVMITLADANTSTNRNVLKQNEECPYEIYLKVKDTAQLSEQKKKAAERELRDEYNAYCAAKKLNRARGQIVTKDHFILAQSTFNQFQLDLKDTEKIQSVNVKNTSPYGQMVYQIDKPIFSVPKHGNDITVDGAEFDPQKSSFYWDHSEKMEKAFEENIDTPYSTFNDIITFTVEYLDGSKAISVVELKFSSDGSATVICKSYDYISYPYVEL